MRRIWSTLSTVPLWAGSLDNSRSSSGHISPGGGAHFIPDLCLVYASSWNTLCTQSKDALVAGMLTVTITPYTTSTNRPNLMAKKCWLMEG